MLNKVLSGRFLFTVCAAFVFVVLSLKGTLTVDKVTEILLIVIYAYFNRNDRGQQNGKEKQNV